MAGIVIDGRFEVEQLLSKSDSTNHYLARDMETGRSTFLKVIRPSSADSNETLQRQMQEYQLLRKIDHPNAVKVIKAGLTSDNAFYIASEFVEGVRISQLVDEQGRISPERMADFLEQLAGVLDLAHSYGIVHRGLSMRNILLQKDDSGQEVCRLVGFASAKVLLDTSANVTQAGITIGSPNYMSPEQALGKKVTRLSDIYSLGVVLFTALTGRLPFVNKNDMMTMVAHVKTPVPSFNEVNPKLRIPQAIEMVVRQALSKEPAYRPKTAGELARMFRQAVENPGVLPDGLSELQESSSRLASSSEQPKQTVANKPTSHISMVFVVLAVAIGAVAGYILSR